LLKRHLPVGYSGIVQRGLVLWLTGDRRGGLALIRGLAAQHHPDSLAGEWIHDVLAREPGGIAVLTHRRRAREAQTGAAVRVAG
jgi:hypothetical protein